MKYFFKLFFFTLFTSSALIVSANNNEDAGVYYQDEQLLIEYQKEVCELSEISNVNIYYYLTFTNLTDRTLTVNFHKTLWYNGRCANCNAADEDMYSLELAAGESISGECVITPNNALQVFHSMIKPENPSVLTKFELRSLTIR